ncbi:hypothetical protein BKA70DRAFT_1237254 [Coprinopsis sp. MPI-PUGE-AT-0042]|nr:hypothetical protein BKA70DRAFT_1243695 [Coprinopsis sp. MPI-PUGE-AT-0042]KAH6885089.1 hypothetical protein BKA70DRAFT_1237254 [Coprinopsis sp. MPI-PUGE-AT-0042]
MSIIMLDTRSHDTSSHETSAESGTKASFEIKTGDATTRVGNLHNVSNLQRATRRQSLSSTDGLYEEPLTISRRTSASSLIGLYNEPLNSCEEDGLTVLYHKPLPSRPSSIAGLDEDTDLLNISNTSLEILALYNEAVAQSTVHSPLDESPARNLESLLDSSDVEKEDCLDRSLKQKENRGRELVRNTELEGDDEEICSIETALRGRVARGQYTYLAPTPP